MENTEKLIEEIRQINIQYRVEIDGTRKQWPKAIKERVFELFRRGLKVRDISRQTGVSYHTLVAWRARVKKINKKFHQLPVIHEPNKYVTVTDTKKQKSVTVKQDATVTIKTPEGFLIKVSNSNDALWFINSLRRGGL